MVFRPFHLGPGAAGGPWRFPADLAWKDHGKLPTETAQRPLRFRQVQNRLDLASHPSRHSERACAFETPWTS